MCSVSDRSVNRRKLCIAKGKSYWFQQGDKNLENVTHEEAVATLKATQDRVVLLVAKPESGIIPPPPPPIAADISLSPQPRKSSIFSNISCAYYCLIKLDHREKRLKDSNFTERNWSVLCLKFNYKLHLSNKWKYGVLIYTFSRYSNFIDLL